MNSSPTSILNSSTSEITKDVKNVSFESGLTDRPTSAHTRNDDLLSLHDVSIASSHRSEVRERIREQKEREEYLSKTFIGKNLFGNENENEDEQPIMKRNSSASSSSSTTTTTNNEYLDNPNFAPPPALPTKYSQPTTFNNNAKGGQNMNELPDHAKIRHSGYIMTRFGKASILKKKWRQNFWILYENNLCFFRSKDDFVEWLLNPFLFSEQRKSLIKRRFDFSRSSDPKRSLRMMYALEKKRVKFYRRSGNMHHFKLNQHVTFGNAISDSLGGAFASLNEYDVVELYTIIHCLLNPGVFYSSCHV